MEGEGMVAVVRGLRDAGLAVTLLDGNRQYTLLPNSTTQPAPTKRPQVANANAATQQSGSKYTADTSTESSAPPCDRDAQAIDGRYASMYKTVHCHVLPTSPPVQLTEFPPQKPDPHPGHGNFQVGGAGSGATYSHIRSTSPAPNFRGGLSWPDRGSVCTPRTSHEIDAFAQSLRKYPCLSPDRSSEVMERLINYTQAKGLSKTFTRNPSSPTRIPEPTSYHTLEAKGTYTKSARPYEPEVTIRKRVEDPPTRDRKKEDHYETRPMRSFEVRCLRDVSKRMRDSVRAYSSYPYAHPVCPTIKENHGYQEITYDYQNNLNSVNNGIQAAVKMISKEVATVQREQLTRKTVAVPESPTSSAGEDNVEGECYFVPNLNVTTSFKSIQTSFCPSDITLKPRKSVQTVFSTMDLHSKHEKTLLGRKSKSQELLSKVTKEDIKRSLLKLIEEVSDCNKSKKIIRDELIRKLFASDRDESKGDRNKSKREKCNKYTSTFCPTACDYVGDFHELVGKLKHCYGDTKHVCRSEITQFRISEYRQLDYVLKDWINNLNLRTIRFMDRTEILNAVEDRIKELFKSRTKEDFDLKAGIVKIIQEIPIEVNKSYNRNSYLQKLVEVLLRRMKNVIINQQNARIRRRPNTNRSRKILTEEDIREFIRTHLMDFFIECDFEICDDILDDLENEILDVMIDSIDCIRCGHVDDAMEEMDLILQDIAQMTEKQANYISNIILQDLQEMLNNCNFHQTYMILNVNNNSGRGSNKSNNTDESIGAITDEDIRMNIDHYTNQLCQRINEWLDTLNLPQIQDKGFKDVVINDLAGDIVDRHKYLELHPDYTPTEEDELEVLKYQIFKWINKLVGDDNQETIENAKVLMEKVDSVPVPMLSHPKHRNLINTGVSEIPDQSPNQSSDPMTQSTKEPFDPMRPCLGETGPNTCSEENMKLMLSKQSQEQPGPAPQAQLQLDAAEPDDQSSKTSSVPSPSPSGKSSPKHRVEKPDRSGSVSPGSFAQSYHSNQSAQGPKSYPMDQPPPQDQSSTKPRSSKPDQTGSVSSGSFVQSFHSNQSDQGPKSYPMDRRPPQDQSSTKLRSSKPDQTGSVTSGSFARSYHSNQSDQGPKSYPMDRRPPQDQSSTKPRLSKPVQSGSVSPGSFAQSFHSNQSSQGPKSFPMDHRPPQDQSSRKPGLPKPDQSGSVSPGSFAQSFHSNQSAQGPKSFPMDYRPPQDQNSPMPRLQKPDQRGSISPGSFAQSFHSNQSDKGQNSFPMDHRPSQGQSSPKIPPVPPGSLDPSFQSEQSTKSFPMSRQPSQDQSSPKPRLVKADQNIPVLPGSFAQSIENDQTDQGPQTFSVPYSPSKGQRSPEPRLSHADQYPSVPPETFGERFENDQNIGLPQNQGEGYGPVQMPFSQIVQVGPGSTAPTAIPNQQRSSKTFSTGFDSPVGIRNTPYGTANTSASPSGGSVTPVLPNQQFTNDPSLETVYGVNLGSIVSVPQGPAYTESSAPTQMRGSSLDYGVNSPYFPVSQSPGIASPMPLSVRKINTEFDNFIQQWVQQIPIAAKTPAEQQTADKARLGIYNGVWKVVTKIEIDPEIFNHPHYYQDAFDDELEGLMKSLPKSKELEDAKPILKAQLFQKILGMIEQIKSTTAPASYKQQIIHCIENDLPKGKHTGNKEEEDKEELDKQNLADYYILHTRFKDEDNIKANVHKKTFLKKLNEFLENIKKRHAIAHMDTIAYATEIINDLDKIPTPNAVAIRDEADDILLGIEVDNWISDLPQKPNSVGPLEKRTVRESIVKKIDELGENLNYNDAAFVTPLKSEMPKYLEKIPLIQGTNVDFMVDELANRIRNLSKFTRPKSVSFQVPRNYVEFSRNMPAASSFLDSSDQNAGPQDSQWLSMETTQVPSDLRHWPEGPQNISQPYAAGGYGVQSQFPGNFKGQIPLNIQGQYNPNQQGPFSPITPVPLSQISPGQFSPMGQIQFCPSVKSGAPSDRRFASGKCCGNQACTNRSQSLGSFPQPAAQGQVNRGPYGTCSPMCYSQDPDNAYGPGVNAVGTSGLTGPPQRLYCQGFPNLYNQSFGQAPMMFGSVSQNMQNNSLPRYSAAVPPRSYAEVFPQNNLVIGEQRYSQGYARVSGQIPNKTFGQGLPSVQDGSITGNVMQFQGPRASLPGQIPPRSYGQGFPNSQNASLPGYQMSSQVPNGQERNYQGKVPNHTDQGPNYVGQGFTNVQEAPIPGSQISPKRHISLGAQSPHGQSFPNPESPGGASYNQDQSFGSGLYSQAAPNFQNTASLNTQPSQGPYAQTPNVQGTAPYNNAQSYDKSPHGEVSPSDRRISVQPGRKSYQGPDAQSFSNPQSPGLAPYNQGPSFGSKPFSQAAPNVENGTALNTQPSQGLYAQIPNAQGTAPYNNVQSYDQSPHGEVVDPNFGPRDYSQAPPNVQNRAPVNTQLSQGPYAQTPNAQAQVQGKAPYNIGQSYDQAPHGEVSPGDRSTSIQPSRKTYQAPNDQSFPNSQSPGSAPYDQDPNFGPVAYSQAAPNVQSSAPVNTQLSQGPYAQTQGQGKAPYNIGQSYDQVPHGEVSPSDRRTSAQPDRKTYQAPNAQSLPNSQGPGSVLYNQDPTFGPGVYTQGTPNVQNSAPADTPPSQGPYAQTPNAQGEDQGSVPYNNGQSYGQAPHGEVSPIDRRTEVQPGGKSYQGPDGRNFPNSQNPGSALYDQNPSFGPGAYTQAAPNVQNGASINFQPSQGPNGHDQVQDTAPYKNEQSYDQPPYGEVLPGDRRTTIQPSRKLYQAPNDQSFPNSQSPGSALYDQDASLGQGAYSQAAPNVQNSAPVKTQPSQGPYAQTPNAQGQVQSKAPYDNDQSYDQAPHNEVSPSDRRSEVPSGRNPYQVSNGNQGQLHQGTNSTPVPNTQDDATQSSPTPKYDDKSNGQSYTGEPTSASAEVQSSVHSPTLNQTAQSSGPVSAASQVPDTSKDESKQPYIDIRQEPGPSTRTDFFQPGQAPVIFGQPAPNQAQQSLQGTEYQRPPTAGQASLQPEFYKSTDSKGIRDTIDHNKYLQQCEANTCPPAICINVPCAYQPGQPISCATHRGSYRSSKNSREQRVCPDQPPSRMRSELDETDTSTDKEREPCRCMRRVRRVKSRKQPEECQVTYRPCIPMMRYPYYY